MKDKKEDPVLNVILTIVLILAVYYIMVFPERLIPDMNALLIMLKGIAGN